MSKFIIRRAKAEDGAALCAIYAPYIMDTTITFEYEVPTDAAFSDRIRETAAQFPYLVCERDGEIIGYAYAHRIRERAAYDWDAELSVYLKQGTHGRGIGTVLLACLIELLEMQGLRHLYSCVTMPNEKSVRHAAQSSALRMRASGINPAGSSAHGTTSRGLKSTWAGASRSRSFRFPSLTGTLYRKHSISTQKS